MYKENPIKKEKKSRSVKERQEKLEREKPKQIFEREPPEEKDDPFIIQCLFCSKKFEYTSILKHVGNTKLCKDFYGPKFQEIQKRHARIRKNIYREENGTKEELQKQREKYSSDPDLKEKKSKQAQERYKIRKQEEKVQDIKRKKESSRREAIEMIDYQLERYKNRNSFEYSSRPDWLSKCFEHFHETYPDVDVKTKEKIDTLLNSIKQNSSDIEESIDSYAKNAKEQIASVIPDNLTPQEFQKLVFGHTNNDFDREISKQWKDFFQTFEATLEDILESAEKSYLNTKWYKSLTKIHRIYKKASKSFRTIDYFCLQEKLCIVCNQKSHHIDFDEELAKRTTTYTYHGDSEFEISMRQD